MYDLAYKYCFCLDDGRQTGHKASLLLLELENYVNGAIMQTARIERNRKSIDKKLKRKKELIKDYQHAQQRIQKDFGLTRLHCDFHFYFICVGQIGKLLKRLCEVLNDHDLNEVYTRFMEKFDKAIRDDLEHIDERAIGKKFQKDIGHISDFGNFPGDRFSFNGKEFPVNREKLNELRQIYHDIIFVLYKNYGSKNEFFVRLEQSERQAKILLRRLRKQGLI
jgi:hypothetical protein